ncbi:MAG: hypothetical protein ACRD1G_03895 [Acidimicrobiales bacterium]
MTLTTGLRHARHGSGDWLSDNRQEPGVVWLPYCRSCDFLDDKVRFETEIQGRSGTDVWTCPECETTDARTLAKVVWESTSTSPGA